MLRNIPAQAFYQCLFTLLNTTPYRRSACGPLPPLCPARRAHRSPRLQPHQGSQNMLRHRRLVRTQQRVEVPLPLYPGTQFLESEGPWGPGEG